MRKMMKGIVAVLAVSALMAGSAFAAGNDKLKVQDSLGTTTVFKVQDDGTTAINQVGNKGFYWDGATSRLGINSVLPLQAELVVTRDIVAGGTVMFLDGVGETGNGPNIAIRTARGVVGAMNATQVGDIVGQANFRGAYGTAGSAAFAGTRRSGFVAYATENYTSTAMGTNVSFVTTANGTVTPTEKLIVNGDGLVYIGQAMKDGGGTIIAPPAVSSTNTKLAIVGDGLRITMTRTPATSTTTCNQGEISYDANYLYICKAANSWGRVALAW